ncbi:hypothetical protein [Flavobacterium microcysteis]
MFFIACNSDSKATKKPENFSIQIAYAGITDKPMPTLIFHNPGEKTFEAKHFDYYYELNYDAYTILNEEITKLKTTKENLALLNVTINKNQNYYLDKSSGLSFISKVITVTSYKNDEQLKGQLAHYLRVLKVRQR